MKISKLRLKNIKCFEDIELSFEDGGGGVKDWSLIVGDNGQGKTTILRGLAVGLCDREGASALLADLYGGFLRREETNGSIEVCLIEADDEKYTIETRIEGDNESISQDVFIGDYVGVNKDYKNKIDDFKRDNLFAVAYGAGRSVEGDRSYEEYALVDSLYTLFKYEHPLQNAELGASRVKIHAKEKEWKKLQSILKEVLMLEPTDKILLGRKGLCVETRRGEETFHNLSDGYKSLTSVIIDFISWNLLYKPDFDLNDLSGIFIIDELEQHLHPKWQRKIVKILSEQFPKVQFICSTHTPICALGLSDLKCESWLFKAAYVNNHSEIERFDLQEDFKGYRADQILTSDIFGLTDARSVSIEDKLKEYRKIYLIEKSKRNRKQRKRLQEIEKELKDLPMWDDKKEKEQRERLIELLESQEKKS